MHECMSDYVGGTLGTSGTSSTKGVEMGAEDGEGCGGRGVGLEKWLKAVSIKP